MGFGTTPVSAVIPARSASARAPPRGWNQSPEVIQTASPK